MKLQHFLLPNKITLNKFMAIIKTNLIFGFRVSFFADALIIERRREIAFEIYLLTNPQTQK